MPLFRETRVALLAGLVALLLFLLPWRHDRGGGDTAPAELLPIAILDGEGLVLAKYRGSSADPPYYLSDRGGRVVSNYPVLPGVLNVPTFAGARLLGVDLFSHRKQLSWLTAVALAAGSSVFFCLWLMRLGFSKRESFAWSLFYALGTCTWSVASTALFQHAPSLFLLTMGLYLLAHEAPAPLAGAGFALGLAVASRPANLALVLPLAVYAVARSRRRSPWFLLGAAVPAALLAWYSLAYWGSLRALGQGPAILFHGNIPRGLLGLLVSPSHGLLVFTPLFFLAFLEFPAAARRGGLFLAIVVGLVLSLLLNARWSMWWGGGSFGYRLLTEQVPFLALLTAAFFSRHRRPWLAAAAVPLVAWSVLVHGLGAFLYPSGFDANIDTMTSKLWSVPDTEITRLGSLALGKLGIAHVSPPADTSGEVLPGAPTWWSAAVNDDSIPGWPDSPTDGQVVVGRLRVSGWARSTSGDVAVQALIDGGRQVVQTSREPRADVAAVFPHLGDISSAGFVAYVDPPPAAAPGKHFILYELRAPNGKVRRIGPVTFRWSRE